VSQPDNGEQALEIAETLVRSGAVDLVVVDSVAALVPQAEIEGEMGDSHVGLQARLMSQALRKLTGVTHSHRHHDHLHQPAAHEDRRDVRLARDDHGRQRAQVLLVRAPRRAPHRRRAQAGDEVVGNRTRVKVVKNKLAPPFQQAEFDIRYGSASTPSATCSTPASTLDVVEKNGAYYSFSGQRIGQGRENAR
jgi:recombination protein RecA